MYLISMLYGFSTRLDLGFLSPNGKALFLLGESGTVPVFMLDRWWTLLSASWLHGSLLHIFFNLMWIRQLAPEVGELYGPGRMVIVYVLGGAIGFLVSSVAGLVLAQLPPPLGAAGAVVGASSPIFSLLGALVYYGNRSGSRHVHAQALSWALSAFVIGLLIPHVDNYAHAGGFLGGFVVGRFLDPLKQEQINHIMIAVVLLALSVLSIIISVIHGIPLLPYLS
jgi:rhomboid protease GluP